MKRLRRHARVYLEDIASAIRRIQKYTAGGKEDFLSNELVQDAVIRQFAIIGEAAAKLPADTKAIDPDIPWKNVIGMRNIVIHDYSEIDLRTIWDTVERDLPALGRATAALLGHPSFPKAA